MTDQDRLAAAKEEMLRASEEKYRSLIEELPVAFIISTLDGRILDINQAGVRLLGHQSKEELLKHLGQKVLFPVREREKIRGLMEKQGSVSDLELSLRKNEGRIFVLLDAKAIANRQGEVVGYRAFLRDITENRILEEELLQAQKMEAIGMLAGGVAHDFNNLLTVIQGTIEIGLMKLDPSHPLYDHLIKIEEATQKASGLTRQLLAFGHRRILNPKAINVSDLIGNLSRMFSRLIGEDIELRLEFRPGVKPVFADPAAIDQILMNLIVNAREAMPRGGIMTIQTRNTLLEEQFTRTYPFVIPGEYVHITFMDTGLGMDQETIASIFKPFFTTREKGVGLGLAVVYSMVKQNKGHIFVSSEPGQGTRFDLYFPACQEDCQKDIPAAFSKDLPRGTETLLIAEDDGEIRELFRHFLEGLGYRVLVACDGEEALALFSAHRERIALAVLDAVMPKLNGPQVYEMISVSSPGLPCLLLSGYSEEIVRRKFSRSLDVPILQKPVAMRELAEKIREELRG